MSKLRGFKNSENKKIEDDLRAGRSIEDIAKDLGRNADAVARQALRIKNKNKVKSTDPNAAPLSIPVLGGSRPEDKVLKELQLSPTYRELIKQLTPSELRFYEENYVDLIMQFGENDTTKSEKLQIHKAVEYLIFMGRNKNEQLDTVKQLDKLKLKIKNYELANPKDEDWSEAQQRYFYNLDEKFNRLNKRRSELSDEYGRLEHKNQELFNDLKGTRKERLTSAEKRMSITDLVSELLQKDKRDRVGKQAEMFKTFTENHNKALTQPLKFADGSFDPPILTPENITNNAKEIQDMEAAEKEKREKESASEEKNNVAS